MTMAITEIRTKVKMVMLMVMKRRVVQVASKVSWMDWAGFFGPL